MPEVKKKCQCYEHQMCHNLQQRCVSKKQSVLPEDGELIPRKSVGVLVKFKSQKKCTNFVNIFRIIKKMHSVENIKIASLICLSCDVLMLSIKQQY